MSDPTTKVDEDRLVTALIAGEWADLTLEPGYCPDSKPILSVAFLTKLLLGSDPRAPLLPFGVRIRGARLDGELNLADCFGPYGGSFGVLALEECDLPGRVTVSNTEFSRLSIRKSRFREFLGEAIRIKADFDFRETAPLPAIDASMSGSAFLWLRGAHIGGDMKGSRSTLRTPSEIPQGMTTAPPAFTLRLAQIGGDLNLGGARLSNPAGLALDAVHIAVEGQGYFDVVGEHRFETDGEVRLSLGRVGGHCYFNGARLTNQEGFTLRAAGCTFGGDLRFGTYDEHRFESEGALVLLNAKISGDLTCNGARLSKSGGVALDAGSIVIGGQAQFSVGGGHRFEADGLLRMSSASIGGHCVFIGARLTNPEDDTLFAANSTLGGDLSLGPDSEHRFESEGRLVLKSAKISGDLICNGARLSKSGGVALDAGSIVIGGQAQLGVGGGHRFEANGLVRMPNASIGGDCYFDGARLTNPEGDALFAYGCTIGGNLLLTIDGEHRFESEGQLDLESAKISGDLLCGGARLSKPGGMALDAHFITATALRAHDNEFTGDIDLSESRIDALGSFAPSAWKGAGRIDLDSISVRQVLVDVEDGVPWKQRRVWLRKNSFRDKNKRLVVSPHPWRECASAFVRSGRNLDARRLLREGYREENRARPKWQQLFVWLFAEIPFGFGMSLVRTTVTVIGFWIVGSVGAEMMSARGVLVEAQASGAPRLCSSAVAPLYALDVAIPFIDLRQESRCDPLDMGQAGLFPGFATTVPSVPWASTTPAIQSPTVRIFEEITLWNWGKAIYSLLGALVVGFAAVTYSGVFKPKE